MFAQSEFWQLKQQFTVLSSAFPGTFLTSVWENAIHCCNFVQAERSSVFLIAVERDGAGFRYYYRSQQHRHGVVRKRAAYEMPQLGERHIRILSASLDSTLNQSRALILRHHGFEVTTSESKENAREQIESSAFDVLVFGNTLPRDTCWELAEVFRRRNPQGKIIEIIPSPWATPKNQPDATVVGTAEPESLIATVLDQVR